MSAAVTAAQAAWPHCELRLVEEWMAVAVTPVDLDRDGTSELHRLTPWQVTLMRQDGQYVWDMPNPGLASGWGPYVFVRDITGDDTADLVITARHPESLFVYLQDLRTKSVRTVRIDAIRPEPGRDPAWAVHCTDFADLTGDGVDEFVCGVVSGYGRQPRGIYAVDLQSGRRLWRFPMGANPMQVVAADVNHDGVPEILVGTVSPGNGCAVNGTDDGHNYAICLDRSGNPLWIRELAEVGAGGEVRLAAADLDRDGVPEVVVSDYCILAHSGPGRLWVLDSRDGRVLTSREMTEAEAGRVTHLVADDLDADGRPEVVTLDGAGRLAVCDRLLRVVRTARSDLEVSAIAACGPLLGAGTKQLAVVGRNNELVVLNHRLEVLGRGGHVRPLDQVLPVAVGSGRPIRLLVLRDWSVAVGATRACLLYELLVQERPFPWSLASIVLGSGLLAVLGITVYSRRSYREQLRYLTRRLVQKSGVMELDRKGRILAANDYARALLRLEGSAATSLVDHLVRAEFAPLRDALDRVLSGREKEADCELMVAAQGASRSYLARVTRVWFGRLFVTLEDLSAVEYARRVAAWAPVAQRLAHGIKTPLSTIRLTAQQLEESGETDAGRLIRDEADRLSKMTDGFMRLADFESPRREPVDLAGLVERVVEQQGVRLMPGIELDVVLPPHLASVKADDEQLARALANIIDNAVAAMAGAGTLTVAARMAGDGRMVEIAISDTGPGIPAAYRERLFQPFFTRKRGGTGLGLCIVKKIIEDHGGTVDFESGAGKGTVFRVLLPVEQEVA